MFYRSSLFRFDNIATPGFWALCCLNPEGQYEESLTEQERNEYTALRSTKRKTEWLSARMALKKILMEANRIESPLNCQIEKDRYGCPLVRIRDEEVPTIMNCSISHKKDISAVCISWIPDLKLGIDLEMISEKPMQLRSAFARQDDSLVGISEAEKYYTVLWACKEAASKSVGRGMMIDFKKFQVKGNSHKKFTIFVNGKEVIRGHYFFSNDFIVALCHLIFFTQ
jgi:phosphopantetheinyl transferase